MLEIYKTPAEMRYIDASEIIQEPHDVIKSLSHYDDGDTILGPSPAIESLYIVLPLVADTGLHCSSEFFGEAYLRISRMESICRECETCGLQEQKVSWSR